MIKLFIIIILILQNFACQEKSTNPKQKIQIQDISIAEVNIGNFVFDCRVAGMSNDGDGVILLHGFPETSHMWIDLMKLISGKGHKVVAPDQRGYSSKARPKQITEYTMKKIVADVFSIADSFEFEKFHLVGHDWGSSIGWGVVALKPDRVLSWTAMSVPHMLAFRTAYQNDKDQRKKSRYFGFFRLPLIPEFYFSFNNYQNLKKIWRKSTDDQIEVYMNVFNQEGALKAALNWYRANIGTKITDDNFITFGEVKTPSQLIWGNKDIALGRTGAELTKKYMMGPYQFVEIDAGHWLIQEAYEEVSVSILDLIERNTIK